jgi:triphosphoribosyl-dephospho-CoA synthase
VSPDEVAIVVQSACLLEASCPKPGNVSPGRAFADTCYEDFLISAAAIGPAFARADTIGATILAAVRATRQRVSANTNLGIVLLLAPLAAAAGLEGGTLRERVARALRGLTLADAEAAYEAIRLAGAGGLGTAPAEDIGARSTVTLLEAMRLAAARDAIAHEYASDYDRTFRVATPALQRARAAGHGWPAAILDAFLRLLDEVPDTLIARKEGQEAAQAVSVRARSVLRAGEAGSTGREAAAAAFDMELRARGNRLNPGATADLVAAALFVALAEES